jgi:rifampin ADP-ribosylating transferase
MAPKYPSSRIGAGRILRSLERSFDPQEGMSMKPLVAPAEPPFYHGTKADLRVGDLIAAGYGSNYGRGRTAAWVYFAATLEAATWGAELARGEGRGRIYVVEPTGPFEDDPNLTDKKFPGNPTRSYRTREPLRIVGEVADWTGHTPEQLKAMRDALAELDRRGIEAIED